MSLNAWRWGAVCVLLCTAAAYLFSPLVWTPVPWPDGSAFYLPGLELIHWPPQWRMHAQAAFVPSYDTANFNLMPALPILLGLMGRSGLPNWIQPAWLIKAVSIAGLLAWAWILWSWTIELMEGRFGAKKARFFAAAFSLAGLWDPVVRWGTLVVRVETWVALCWLWCFREITRWERIETSLPTDGSKSAWPRTAWRIAAGLALSAYFHFEAAYFVPAVIVGLGFRGDWFRRLCGVAARTTALLSPWLLYVALHFGLFVEQMQIQFHRLSHDNPWTSTAYGVFHSLFIEHGSPVGTPKFFNLGKGVFWAMLACLLVASVRTLRTSRTLGTQSRVALAGAIAFFATYILWHTKAEFWFIALCHLAFWPWAAAVASVSGRRTSAALAAGAAGFALLSGLASIGQARAISATYNWETYGNWINCIVRAAESEGHGATLRFWQPGTPDVLVDLSRRRPDWDLTRALDFQTRKQFALNAAQSMDAVLLSGIRNPGRDEIPAFYEGPLRETDRHRLSHGEDVLFGPWALEELKSPRWKTLVCEAGPFWSAVLIKKH